MKKFLKYMHDSDGLYKHESTCYTISLTIHLYLFLNGIDSIIYYGITKIDEKIFGHAWVKVDFFKIKYTFNPGNINLDRMKVIEKKSMYSEAISYAFKQK